MAKDDSNNKNAASDSSKKVAKAARAGQTPAAASGRENRQLGFPAALAGIIIAGVALVAVSWNSRDAEALTPTFDNHWHVAYGIYDCQTGGFLPNLADPGTANAGIHTHGDGVVHIHPFSSSATGDDAQLIRFLEATNTEIRDDAEMTFRDREALVEGVDCDGEEAVLQVARFDPNQTEPSEILTEDLVDFRFQRDQEMVVIALAPVGFEIPPPPQANIDQAAAASPNILRTDGLNDLDSSGGAGFDDDGNLLDQDGNIILNDDGEPININDLLVEQTETGDDAGDDTESDDSDAESDG